MPDYEPPPPPPPEMEQLRCQAVRDMGLDLQSEEPSLDFITQICHDIFQVHPLPFQSQRLCFPASSPRQSEGS